MTSLGSASLRAGRGRLAIHPGRAPQETALGYTRDGAFHRYHLRFSEAGGSPTLLP